MSISAKIPAGFRVWYDVLIWLGLLLLIIGLTGSFIVPIEFPPFISRAAILGLAAGFLIIGTTEKAINVEVSDGHPYFAQGLLWKRRRMPTKLSWIIEGIGIFSVLASLIDIILASLHFS